MITTLINILILFIAPFIMLGIIKKTKAFWAGRKGVSIFQPIYDFIRLMNKVPVYPETTSYVYKIAPVISFATVVFAALFVPLASGNAIINLPFAFVIFSYSLALGKFFSLIASLDTGSSFEGMGASREACFSTIVEPAFFITAGSIAAIAKSSSFDSFKMITENSGVYGYLIIALAVLTLYIMLLIECCRVPVDDPTTHLELTMIHEVMVLDNSGPDLALITYGSAIKMFLFEALIASLLIPAGASPAVAVALFLALIAVTAVITGCIESMTARFRMTHVFEFIFIMSVTALLVLTLVTYGIYGK